MDKHALVIDDNHLNNEVLILLLEKEGMTCTAIESPRALPQTLKDLKQVDVVFLDLQFPNTSGFDLLDDLKNEPRLSQVPIVACTVYTSEISAARRAGFHSFLGKPLDVQRFPEQLRKILSGIPVWET